MSSSSSDSHTPSKRRTKVARGDNKDSKAVKRRASKACKCCRTRKVRCDVVEHGLPCTNCRLDEVECLVMESKRRKKLWLQNADFSRSTAKSPHPVASTLFKTAPLDVEHPVQALPDVESPISPVTSLFNTNADTEHKQHVPHLIYQSHAPIVQSHENARRASFQGALHTEFELRLPASAPHARHSLDSPTNVGRAFTLPGYIKPLPARISLDDENFLAKKGALSIPDKELRDQLLRSYLEYVHPFMPLLDLNGFLEAIECDGSTSRVSLLLLQAVMFAGSAFVDVSYLRAAGYDSRKLARKELFRRTKLLYDFDYEIDRITLVQALLLMTFWYESPDDQKDTLYWMGVAVSLAYTIGLHRNTEASHMALNEKRLWKRIWWSCFMRDRLVALGMRRPTRIRVEDHDVPMLTLDDFQLQPLSDSITSIPRDCTLARDVDMQRSLAVMCVEKAKLSLCISSVLTTQYAVWNTHQGSFTADGHTTTTMMLLPKKPGSDISDVRNCDRQLQDWADELPPEASYRAFDANDPMMKRSPLLLHIALVHLLYHTAISALYRPQVLPCAPSDWNSHTRDHDTPLHDISRKKVHSAATKITRIARDLHDRNLTQYLPSTGVTVLLPAIVIHLMDMKASEGEDTETSLLGFRQCMQVMQRLCETYAAAYYATQFLEAAIIKAGIIISGRTLNLGGLLIAGQHQQRRQRHRNVSNPSQPSESSHLTPPPEPGFRPFDRTMKTFQRPVSDPPLPGFYPHPTALASMTTPSSSISARSSSSTLDSLSSHQSQGFPPSLVSYPSSSMTSFDEPEDYRTTIEDEDSEFDALVNLENTGQPGEDVTMKAAPVDGGMWMGPASVLPEVGLDDVAYPRAVGAFNMEMEMDRLH